MSVVERFAPSPTGRLHLGHAYSALLAFEAAREAGGRFLLRIEDIDTTRSREEFVDGIYEDLEWLGLEWEEPVLRQTERFEAYRAAIEQLLDRELLYACTCTRKQIAAAMNAPQEGAEVFPTYPGTCRGTKPQDVSGDYALRLDMRRAMATLGGNGVVTKQHWRELPPKSEKKAKPKKHSLDPDSLTRQHGDVVLARKDIPASYHLSVVLDDAFQGVTHVTRGEDLREFTMIHRLLQAVLGRPTPEYRHHRLIRDDDGNRLAKRDDARALATLRAGGATPQDVREILGV